MRSIVRTHFLIIFSCFCLAVRCYIPGSFSIPSSSDGNPNSVYTNDPVWEEGTTQTLVWQSSCSSIDLDIWQQANSKGEGSRNLTNLLSDAPCDDSPYSFPWLVSVGNYDLSISPVFFFRVYCHDTKDYFGSHYVNITKAATATSTTLTKSSSATSSSPSSSSSLITIPATLKASAGGSTGLTIATTAAVPMSTSASITTRRATRAEATSTSSSTATTVTDEGRPTDNTPQGLSAGVRAGIGVAISLVAMALLLTMLVPRLRRKLYAKCLKEKRTRQELAGDIWYSSSEVQLRPVANELPNNWAGLGIYEAQPKTPKATTSGVSVTADSAGSHPVIEKGVFELEQ